MATAQPGWYPDPRHEQGELRWWDGQAWTSWLAPLGTTEPPPAPALQRLVPDDVRVQRQWHRARVAAGVVAAVVAVMAVAGVVSLRRVPAVAFPTPGPPVTAAPSLASDDFVVDQGSGYGRIGTRVRFRMPAAPFRETAHDAAPPAMVSAGVTRSLTGDGGSAATDSYATLALLRPDLVNAEGHRTIAPSLLRALASSIWTTGQTGQPVVGEVETHEVDGLPAGHSGVLVRAPVTSGDNHAELLLELVQVSSDEWLAWWEVRQPGLAAAQAAQLDQARSAIQVVG